MLKKLQKDISTKKSNVLIESDLIEQLSKTSIFSNEKIESMEFSWIGGEPSNDISLVLLVPFYNELSQGLFKERLDYFNTFACQNQNLLDVIMIDDGSDDGSLEEILSYTDEKEICFYTGTLSQNSNKVGAQFLAVLNTAYEFVLLSDFDTDIFGIENITQVLEALKKNDEVMGCYFKMKPYEKPNLRINYQILEYALLRIVYTFHKRDLSCSVMPGAGSLYKRKTLLEIFRSHSGFRSGEDRESCILGLKLGYKTVYFKEVLILTRTPDNFNILLKQRIRWNLGYIDTVFKEFKFYFRLLARGKTVGLRFIIDLLRISSLMIFPFLLAYLAIWQFSYMIYLLLIIYSFYVIAIGLQVKLNKDETSGFTQSALLIVIYPILRLLIEYPAWLTAIYRKAKDIVLGINIKH